MIAGKVTTVLGPLAPAELGLVDAHSHVWIAPVAGAAADAPRLADRPVILRELLAYKAAGGGSVVDCQPAGCGRDGRMLRRLAQDSGVQLIAATGFHRRIYYPPEAPLWQMDASSAAATFVAELTKGLAETLEEPQPVQAGFIKIAGEATLAASPTPLLEAAAIACHATGCAIEMHTEKGAAVAAFLRFFVDRGVAPQRLVFCHVDKRPDFALHRDIAATGAMLEYDTFFRPKYRPDETVWPLLQQMVAAGLAGQIALATDMADSGMWLQYGGQPGMAAFCTQIRPRLARLQLDPVTIDQLMGGNIARRLAILPDKEERT